MAARLSVRFASRDEESLGCRHLSGRCCQYRPTPTFREWASRLLQPVDATSVARAIRAKTVRYEYDRNGSADLCNSFIHLAHALFPFANCCATALRSLQNL